MRSRRSSGRRRTSTGEGGRTMAWPDTLTAHRGSASAASRWFAVLELLLPVEHPALGRPFLRFRHVAGLLTDARDVRVGEQLVGHELDDTFGGGDRLVEATEIGERHR